MDGSLLSFVENILQLVPLSPRTEGFDVLADTNINPKNAKKLADAAEEHWNAILNQDPIAFGRTLRKSFEAQVAMFPHMLNKEIQSLIDKYSDIALGWKLSGAGGGGYLILAAVQPIPGTMRVTVRKEID